MASRTRRTSNGRELLTVGETARLLRISGSTVRRLARRGELPAVRYGRQWRIDLDGLDRDMTTPTPEEPPNA